MSGGLKYHVVFIPRCRGRILYKQLMPYLKAMFRRTESQWESRIEEEHVMPDHVHMMILIPAKYAVSTVHHGEKRNSFGRMYRGHKRSFMRRQFWARGYFVPKVVRDETVIREYIRRQEHDDERLGQKSLFG